VHGQNIATFSYGCNRKSQEITHLLKNLVSESFSTHSTDEKPIQRICKKNIAIGSNFSLSSRPQVKKRG
jgi:hypothetical protein